MNDSFSGLEIRTRFFKTAKSAASMRASSAL
jgi:hypothetical protein